MQLLNIIYICARTLDASAIAIRARSLADFISSGRIRLRLDVGRFFMAPVERGPIEADCFLRGGDCVGGMGLFICWCRPVSTVNLDDDDDILACGLLIDGSGMLLVWRLMDWPWFPQGS